MAFFAFILLVSGTYATIINSTPSQVLKPGALVDHIGEVLVVEDVISVKYNLINFLSIPEQNSVVFNRIREIGSMLNGLSTSHLSDDLHNIVLIQQIRISKLTDLIYTVRRKLPLSSEELYILDSISK